MTPEPLFREALGAEDFDALPQAVRDLHMVIGSHHWRGEASVTRGESPLAGPICAMFGFPPPAEATEVEVSMRRDGAREIWERRFGASRFQSTIELAGPPGAGIIAETVKGVRCVVPLRADKNALEFPVHSAGFLGLPLPRLLVPGSRTREYQENGRFRFDVGLGLALVGDLVRYQGWLLPAD